MGADNVGTVVYNTNQGCLEIWVQKDNTPTFGWVSLCGGSRKPPITPVPPGTPTPPSPLLPPATPSTDKIPVGIEVADGGFYLASIYDTDYLPYIGDQSGTADGKVGPYNADGTVTPNNREPVIDYQKTIDHTGIEVVLPINTVAGSTFTLSTELTFTATVPAALTSDGVKNIDLELIFKQSLNSGVHFTNHRKFLIGTLRTKNSGDILKPIKLDINVGNGSSGRGVPLAEFQIPHASGSPSVKFYLNAVTGIPDRYFDIAQELPTNPTEYLGKYLHHFVYVPMYGLDGKVWLNQNLGSLYSSLDHMAGYGTPPTLTALALGEPSSHMNQSNYTANALYPWRMDVQQPGIYFIKNFSTAYSDARRISNSQTIPVSTPCPVGYIYPSVAELQNYATASPSDYYRIIPWTRYSIQGSAPTPWGYLKHLYSFAGFTTAASRLNRIEGYNASTFIQANPHYTDNTTARCIKQ